MKKIIVSSKNPVKLNSTLEAFKTFFKSDDFEVIGVSAKSDVSDQPMTEDETVFGAKNRMENAFKDNPNADYWVGIEGGVDKIGDEMVTFAWVFIKSKEMIGKARSSTFFLPKKIARLVEEGHELGDADDIVFGKSNSKQQNGAIGLLTGDVITRTSAYTQTIILALIPLKNINLYT